MAFDRRALFVGSMNLDPRSVFTNTEIGVVVEQAELATLHAEHLVGQLADIGFRVELRSADGPDSAPRIEWVTNQEGQEIRYSREPMAGSWLRFKTWLFSLMPIEHLL
jgi:putative cardiolipin synthase